MRTTFNAEIAETADMTDRFGFCVAPGARSLEP